VETKAGEVILDVREHIQARIPGSTLGSNDSKLLIQASLKRLRNRYANYFYRSFDSGG
jgi:hypothetical protein